MIPELEIGDIIIVSGRDGLSLFIFLNIIFDSRPKTTNYQSNYNYEHNNYTNNANNYSNNNNNNCTKNYNDTNNYINNSKKDNANNYNNNNAINYNYARLNYTM